MKYKVISKFVQADETYEAGEILDIEDAGFVEKMSEHLEEYVDIKKAEKVDVEVDNTVEVEVKDLSDNAEEKQMSIEVGDIKLSPEQKMSRTFQLAKALKTNKWTEEAKAAAGQNEATAADGGALVDEEIVKGIFANAVEAGQIFNKCGARPVGRNNNTLEIKQLNETSGTPADYNGVVVGVSAEGAVITPQKLAYKRATASVNKLTALIPMTSEILEDDAHGILEFTEKQVGTAFGLKLDDEVLYGTSSLLTAAVGDAGSAAITLADSSAPTIAEVHQMYMAGLNPARSEWYMSGAVYESLNQQESTSGGPVIVPNYAISPFGTLLGRKVNVVNTMLGADTENGTIGFCDFSDGYVLGTKGGVKFAESIHIYFDTDDVAFRWTLRVAGLPTKASTMTLKDGRIVSPLVFGADAT